MKAAAREKLVMVFGVFDGLHPGHFYFLRQAKKYGKVIAVVARDSAVFKLKKRKPVQSEKKRLRAMMKVKGVTLAVLGDKKQGVYSVIKKYKPNIICLGYDQGLLKKDLEEKMFKKFFAVIRLIQLAPYRPHEFHTSLLK